MTLSDPVTAIKGVGDELAKKLAALGIQTVADLLEYLPRRYDDYSTVGNVKNLRPGPVTIRVKINNLNGRYVRRGMHITEALASDETGSVRLTWFNQPYRAAAIKAGQEYFVAGEYALRHQRFSIASPSVELVSDFPVNTARIIPIYKETKGLKSSAIRKLVKQAIIEIEELPEHLPDWLRKENQLIVYARALTEMHFPSGAKALALARRRLAFEEVFELSLAALLNKREFTQNKGLALPFDEKLARRFVAGLPFALTDAQRKVAWQIYKDMQQTTPMNRLVEGDVGSGKTVVAAMAAVMAINSGFQVALMAPTEILARQHAETLQKLLSNISMGEKVSLLTGDMTPKQKNMAHSMIAGGEIGLIIGTHALISENVNMHKLGLVIIDEQHRFGVEQRKKLQAKAGHMPHILHMSATPIPRSIALTLYGELDISVIDELPAGRQPVKTEICSPNSRKQLYAKVIKELNAGKQMFVVCPLISDSDNLPGLSAESVFERTKRDFKHQKIGLLHGRMKSAEKDQVMQNFIDKKIDILVSTTVIEVGVDISNATVMLIEGAERFGLAQIHQLRGRVGRGAHQSYCYLILSDSRAPGQRLEALQSTNDGFKLAELDLKLRGPGAIYGTVQHGALDLRVASLSDTKLIATARNAAKEFLDKKEKLADYPYILARVSALRAITNLN